MSGRASTPRPPIYRRLSVVNSPNSPISGRNPGGELTDPIKRWYSAVFRRQPRSRVQDAHGFFLMAKVFRLAWFRVVNLSVFCLCCPACFFGLLLDIFGFFFCMSSCCFSSCLAICCAVASAYPFLLSVPPVLHSEGRNINWNIIFQLIF